MSGDDLIQEVRISGDDLIGRGDWFALKIMICDKNEKAWY